MSGHGEPAPVGDALTPDPMTMDEGARVAALVYGEPPFERPDAPEPPVLAFVARCCHDWLLGDLWGAARTIGEGGPFAAPAVDETVADTLVSRFGATDFSFAVHIDPLEIEVRRTILSGAEPGDELWERVGDVADGWRRGDLLLRLAARQPRSARCEAVLDDVDPTRVGADGSRRWLHLAQLHDRRAEVDDVLGELADPVGDPGRAAHLVRAILDLDRRRALADQVIEEVDAIGAPDWFVALVASRLGFFAGRAPDLDRLVEPVVWRPIVERLATALPAIDVATEVRRVVPHADWYGTIERPHESLGDAPNRTLGRWGGSGPPMGESLPEAARPELPDDAFVPSSPPPSTTTELTDVRRMPGRAGHDPRLHTRVTEAMGPTPRRDARRDERRLGIDLFVDEVESPLPLPPGRIGIDVSIAPEARFQISPPVDIPFAPGQAFRLLPVRLLCGDADLEEVMQLPADPSEAGRVRFTVTAAPPDLHGTVIVYDEHHSKVLVAGAFRFRVDDGDDPVEHDDDADFVRIDTAAIGGLGRPPSGSVVLDRAAVALAAPEVRIPAQATAVAAQTASIVRGIQIAASRFSEAGVPPDATIRALARVGAGWYRDLGLSALDGHRHVQMVTLDAQSVFPLDLVYDGPEPDDDAELCPEWTDERTIDACPHCDALEPSERRRFVCAVCFWGVKKVIEHHQPDPTTTAYVARVHPDGDAVDLDPFDPVLVGRSTQVIDEAADEMGRLVARIGERAVVAEDWPRWEQAVAAGPGLLVALPHHEQIEEAFVVRPALEIGSTFLPSIREQDVRAEGRELGPLVLLLGCSTAVEQLNLMSFAAGFRRFAPAVVATLGEVIAREAPHVAEVIVDELVGAPATEPSVGAAVRRARRRLMAERWMVGFQLVVHGSGDWEVAT